MSLVCSWNDVCDVLCQVSSSPFCRAPSGECRHRFRTVPNATLADATLVFWILNSVFLFQWSGHPGRTNRTLTKAASIPARRHKGQGSLDLFFDAAPHLECCFQCFELSTKAAFAKEAFDTLRRLDRISAGQTQRAQDWKSSISRGENEKIKLSIRNEVFNREWNFHSGPLSGRRKTAPGIEIFNQEWNFQTENENFKREWKFQAWGNGFSMRSIQNEFFRSQGPLGMGHFHRTKRTCPWHGCNLRGPAAILFISRVGIPPTPDRGPNPHFLKKRVSGSKNPPFPSFRKREFSTGEHVENGDF